jgi:hypothetical protein
MNFFPHLWYKDKVFFETSCYVIILRHSGVDFFLEDTNKIITSRYCILFFVFHIFAIRQALMRDVS